MSLSESWNYLAEKIVQLIEKYVPVNKVRSDSGRNNPCVNGASLHVIKDKHKKWLKYQHCMTDENYDIYKKARTKVKSEIRKSNYQFEKDLTTKIKQDNKLFWSYVRSKSKTKTVVGKLEMQNGQISNSDLETACTLNQYFASVFEVEGDGELPEFQERPYTSILETVDLSEEVVANAILHIKPGKSQGLDLLHPKLIKETASI